MDSFEAHRSHHPSTYTMNTPPPNPLVGPPHPANPAIPPYAHPPTQVTDAPIQPFDQAQRAVAVNETFAVRPVAALYNVRAPFPIGTRDSLPRTPRNQFVYNGNESQRLEYLQTSTQYTHGNAVTRPDVGYISISYPSPTAVDCTWLELRLLPSSVPQMIHPNP
jgi:hypothetical protein